MRVFNVQPAARPTYYDRNPIVRNQNGYNNGIAPHATAQRWAYTVPAGKKAFCEVLYDLVFRNTVAAPAGFATVTVNYTPSGGAAAQIDIALIATNGVGDKDNRTTTGFGAMIAGDNLAMTDADSSTGGTCTFLSNAKIIEYDS